MSFLTEEADNVNTTLSETLQHIREQLEAGAFPKYPDGTWGKPMTAYWPTHPSASNHAPSFGNQWGEDMHPKD